MIDFDVDALEIDTSSTIKLVASVSFDKNKKQFKYSEGFKETFGANADLMMQRQGNTQARAIQRWNQAEVKTNRKGRVVQNEEEIEVVTPT